MARAFVNKPLGLGDNCLGPRKGGSTPYYLFGTQRRYAYAWHGGPGGVPNGYRAAESRAMGGLGGTTFGGNTKSASAAKYFKAMLSFEPDNLGVALDPDEDSGSNSLSVGKSSTHPGYVLISRRLRDLLELNVSMSEGGLTKFGTVGQLRALYSPPKVTTAAGAKQPSTGTPFPTRTVAIAAGIGLAALFLLKRKGR